MRRLSKIYQYSLHQEKEDPENGYGYDGYVYPISRCSIETIQSIADYLNEKQICHKPEMGKFVVTQFKD